MSMFRAKKLDLGCFVNVRTLRDHTKRKVFEAHETERQALRYIIRNTTLPPRVRAEAQLQLTQMHCYTRPTQIRNRCIMGGQGRGVLSDFKMTRAALRFLQSTSSNTASTSNEGKSEDQGDDLGLGKRVHDCGRDWGSRLPPPELLTSIPSDKKTRLDDLEDNLREQENLRLC
ncbi:hypothetical protein FOXB_00500 [Fusarium oxysporum f. sp. conglutinans Fo5176]|uniref:Uncharacterized protein n=1 Tax=Fusarium oxysporum (strain Fo5176) TaxID=660025 RepID=F9F276_FUSOF|nr:hypothetical protein FOXB_00500 [Fusarium oxysporum f. sp. conglutinans Fo5176]